MAANTANLMDPAKVLDPKSFRASLERMDDSIIFSLLERTQYRQNTVIYKQNNNQLNEMQLHELKFAGSNGCLADWFLAQTECLHSQAHRYQHPTEKSFFGPLWEPTLGNVSMNVKAPKILASTPKESLMSTKLLATYRGSIITALCEKGDDGDYGSSAVQDVHCVQAMATRIHFSLLSAESKFCAEREKATLLIRDGDREGLLEFIADPEADENSIRRAVSRARAFAGSDGEEGLYKVSPEHVGEVFRRFLLPLAKQAQLEYLLARVDGEPNAKRQRLEDVEVV